MIARLESGRIKTSTRTLECLAYLFLDQTPLTIPAALRTDIKRSDFPVAVDGLGTKARASSMAASCSTLPSANA